MDDEAAAEEASTCFHDELFCFYSRERARGKGVKVDRTIHSFRPKSELSVEDRKKHVEKAKANSSCRQCGQKGHWAGDACCPSRGEKGKGKGQKRASSACWPKRFLLATVAPLATFPSPRCRALMIRQRHGQPTCSDRLSRRGSKLMYLYQNTVCVMILHQDTR